MIKINKITTKTGDKGTTLGPGMEFINKFDDNIEFLGQLDELNSYVGQIIANANIANAKKPKLCNLLTQLQHQLFDIGAMFFSQNEQHCPLFIEFLETEQAKFNANLKELTSFLLPQGNKLIVSLHIARVKAREAERMFWKISSKLEDNKMEGIGIYLNRFSDLLFSMIRKYSQKDAKPWIPLNTRKSL